MAAIFDLRHTQTSNSIITFTGCFMALKTPPGSSDIAFEIELISCILADVRVVTLFQPPPGSSDIVTDNTIEKFDLGNMGVAIGILFRASLKPEIP